MRYLFIILSLCSVNIYSQSLVKVYGQGNYTDKAAIKGDTLYTTSRDRGLLIVNTLNGQLTTINAENSPLKSNEIYSFQIISPDTFIISAGFDNWLYSNSRWIQVGDIYWKVVMTKDGRIFGINTQNNTFNEFQNGFWNNISDSLINFTPLSFQYDNDNNIYITSSDGAIYKYNYSGWQLLPVVPNINLGYKLVFDNLNNLYIQSSNFYYKFDGTNWITLPTPTDSIKSELLSVITDSSGLQHFFLNTSNPDPPYQTYQFLNYVSNGAKTILPLDSLGINTPNAYGTYAGLTKSNKTVIVGYGGIYIGNLTNLYKYEISNTPCFKTIACKVGNSLYGYDTTGNVVQIDTSLNSCSTFYTTPSYNVSNDYFGNIWVLDTNIVLHNVTTGFSKNLKYLITSQVDVIYCYGYGNNFWLLRDYGINNHSIYFFSNGSLTYVSDLIWFYAHPPVVDKYGNLWVEQSVGYSSEIYRITPQGALDSIYRHPSSNIEDGTYDAYYSIDDSGYAWVKRDDTLSRYDNSIIPNYNISIPHEVATNNRYIKVFDSTEAIIVGYYKIYYLKNGVINTYPNKLQNTAYINVFPLTDSTFLLCSRYIDESIELYNTNYPDINTGAAIHGVCYLDGNNNHYKEINENAIPYGKIFIDSNCVFTDYLGQYTYYGNNGSITIKPEKLQYYIAYPDSYNIQVNNVSLDTINFAYHTSTPVNDLEISISNAPFPLGYHGTLFTSIINRGTSPTPANVVLQYDSSLTLLTSGAQIISQGNGTCTFNAGILYPMQETNFMTNFEIGAVPTDTLPFLFIATVNPVSNDSIPENNTDSLLVSAVSSFDPNDKTVEPAGFGLNNTIDTGQELTYTIRFQNTGTYKAFKVVLIDTLSNKLDLSTFKYIASSAKCSFSISNHILTVTFKDINLPFANENEMESHGYFKFSIKPITSIKYGDSITNKASIYFDFNEPIVTNETEVVFGEIILENAQPHNINNNSISIFPEPFSNSFTIHLSNSVNLPCNLQIFNSSGQLVLEKKINGINELVRTSQIAAGTYTIRVIDNQKQQFTTNCIKVK